MKDEHYSEYFHSSKTMPHSQIHMFTFTHPNRQLGAILPQHDDLADFLLLVGQRKTKVHEGIKGDGDLRIFGWVNERIQKIK